MWPPRSQDLNLCEEKILRKVIKCTFLYELNIAPQYVTEI